MLAFKHVANSNIITTSGRTQQHRPFSALVQYKSIVKYARIEVSLLWTLLMHTERTLNTKRPGSSKADPKSLLFILKPDVVGVLLALSTQLNNKHLSSKNIKVCLRNVFRKLYFPDDMASAYNSPIEAYSVLQFLAYQFITSEAAYISIFLIPPKIAKIQYLMRLRSIYEIDQLVQSSPNDWARYDCHFVTPYTN